MTYEWDRSDGKSSRKPAAQRAGAGEATDDCKRDKRQRRCVRRQSEDCAWWSAATMSGMQGVTVHLGFLQRGGVEEDDEEDDDDECEDSMEGFRV